MCERRIRPIDDHDGISRVTLDADQQGEIMVIVQKWAYQMKSEAETYARDLAWEDHEFCLDELLWCMEVGMNIASNNCSHLDMERIEQVRKDVEHFESEEEVPELVFNDEDLVGDEFVEEIDALNGIVNFEENKNVGPMDKEDII